MNVLAESENYRVYNEYENVILHIKESNKKIQIGDFYGNPQMALISEDETVCVMCGCGVIIYYLKEPFREYEYHTQTKQWREWGRNSAGAEIWVESIRYIDNKTIEIIAESGDIYQLNIHDSVRAIRQCFYL